MTPEYLAAQAPALLLLAGVTPVAGDLERLTVLLLRRKFPPEPSRSTEPLMVYHHLPSWGATDA